MVFLGKNNVTISNDMFDVEVEIVGAQPMRE